MTALTCSLPSHLRLTYEFLGNDPCCLSVNNVVFHVSKFGPLDSIAGWIGFVATEPDFGMWPSSHSQMCYGKSSYELRLLPNPLSSQVAACSLEVVAYYSGCFSSHSSGCSDYSGYLSNSGLDSDFDSGTCSNMYYLHNVPVVVDSADSHTVLALLSSAPTDNP